MEGERENDVGQIGGRGKRSGSWRDLWPLGALALLCLIFYWDVFWLPHDRVIAGRDLTDMFLRWLRFTISSVQEGRLPLWNPYLFCGIPYVANPQPALFYPSTWLGLLMPATRALGYIIVLHLWLAGAGMYLWLRSEKASMAGALFAATVLAFSGYFFVRVYAGHLGHFTTWAWLPLLWWVYRRVVERRSWRLAVVGGLPVGLSFLGGNTALFIYVALGLGAYALFHAWRGWWEERSVWTTILPLLLVGVMLFVGLALSAAQILPMAELAMRSTREASAGYDFAARFSWPPGYLLTLLVPDFFGEPAHTGYWGDGIYDEYILYVGVLPLLLALLGLKLRHRLKPFLFALGLGGLLLAFGEYGILHRLFYRFLPVFGTVRAPARAGFFFTLTAAALSGLTVTKLQGGSQRERERLLRPLRWQVILTVGSVAALIIVAGFAAFAWGRETNEAAGRLWHVANRVAIFLFFFLLSVGLLTAWRTPAGDTAPSSHGGRRGGSPRGAIWLLAIGLAVLDLWTFGSGMVEAVDAHESGYWRIVAQAVDDPEAARVLPWGLNDVEQNGGMAFGLRSVFGYDPLVLQRFQAFIDSRIDPLARTYDLLNAGYLVTTAPQTFPDRPDAPKLVHRESGVYVYERPTALPRAWIVPQVEVMDSAAMLARIHQPDFDPRATALVEAPLACPGAGTGQVEITYGGGNRIEARTEGGGGVLVFSEIDYPGWRATVDGEPTRLIRADYLLRALCVPAGEHHVVMTYDPPLLKVGLSITGLTLACIVGIAISLRKKR